MRRLIFPLALAFLFAACGDETPAPLVPSNPAPEAVPMTPTPVKPAFAYPPARRGEVVDDLHGVKVADPYRWLEDLDSPETREWIAAQNRLTDSVLSGLPDRESLGARIGALYRFPRYGIPIRRGKRWFWMQRDPGQEQTVVYRADSPSGTPALLVDPNAISPDGRLAFEGYSPSENGDWVAYGMAAGGGDWQNWRLREVSTGKDLPDVLAYVKYYPPQLTPDGKGVYYSRFPAPQPGKELSETDHDCKVYFHAVGTPESADVIVFERPDQPTWQFEPHIGSGGRYLVVAIGDGQVGDRGLEQVVLFDLSQRTKKPVYLVDRFEAEYVLAGTRGPALYFKTTAGAPRSSGPRSAPVPSAGAPRKRVVVFDANAALRGGSHDPKEIVPEGPDAIEDAVVAGGRLLVTTLKDAHHALSVYELSGRKVRDVELPGLGTALTAEGGPDDTEAFYAFQSFTTPSTVYRHDLAKGTSTVWKAPAVAWSPAEYETRQVFFASRDGTRIPMFVTGRRGLANDGKTPTLLTGYGGFGVSVTPELKPELIAWLERGGVLAVANLRGGGEYGEAWHLAAVREKKQVTFDDFIAAAEWLEANGVTNKQQLGIFGRSGGGLLVAAVAVQRPDVFGAVAPLAGVEDMVRFTRFGQGAGWAGDFGSPDVPSELEALLKYSPLHNVAPGTSYPAMYIVTADHDVRVAPLHSYKFAAALQAAQAGPEPILLRVETTSGHGGGTTVSSRVDQSAELLSFFGWALRGAPGSH